MKTLLLLILILPLGAAAQGSGSIATPPTVSGSDAAPFRVTKSVTGTVAKIQTESLSIEDAKSRKIVELLLAPATKPRVSGSGAKALTDIAEGASVRINYAADDRRVLDVRVLSRKAQQP